MTNIISYALITATGVGLAITVGSKVVQIVQANFETINRALGLLF